VKIMPEYLHITGMLQASPNADTKDIRFALSASEGPPIMCVARYGVAAQIASGLGTALGVLRMALASEMAIEPVAVEEVQAIHIQRDLLSDQIVLELTTKHGIPHIFQIPSQTASEFADRLRTEAAKPTQAGNA
jgi:hypothetical protein